MTDWREQAVRAYRSAMTGAMRVTGSAEAAQMTAVGAALGTAEPLIRKDERARFLPLLQAADEHITYLSNLLSRHTDRLAWDDGPDLDAAIAEMTGDDHA